MVLFPIMAALGEHFSSQKSALFQQFLNVSTCQGLLEPSVGLVKSQKAKSQPRISETAGLGWSPRIWISDTFLDGDAVAHYGLHLENLCFIQFWVIFLFYYCECALLSILLALILGTVFK